MHAHELTDATVAALLAEIKVGDHVVACPTDPFPTFGRVCQIQNTAAGKQYIVDPGGDDPFFGVLAKDLVHASDYRND